MITPQNIKTGEVLALAIAPACGSTRLPLVVKTWDTSIRRWTLCTDAALTARAEEVARETMTLESEQQGKPEAALYRSFDTVFLGVVDVAGASAPGAQTRVLVEVR